MIKRYKTIKNLVFINTDFKWGASEAPGSRRVRRYVKTALVYGVFSRMSQKFCRRRNFILSSFVFSYVSVRKTEERLSLGRPRRRQEDNIKMCLKQRGWVWSVLFWLRTGTSGGLLWTRQWNFWFHKSESFLTSWETISFSRRIMLHELVVNLVSKPRHGDKIPSPRLVQYSSECLKRPSQCSVVNFVMLCDWTYIYIILKQTDQKFAQPILKYLLWLQFNTIRLD
jgi:hypothetical protein